MELWHRVYRVTPELASARWGREVAAAVPGGGLVDVHTFRLVDQPVALDVTFPVGAWDGRSPIVIASGPGEDVPAGPDPVAAKQELVATHCDPALRERFIDALSLAVGQAE